MKIFKILTILLLTQSACFAYTINYNQPFLNGTFYRRGVITGVPAPIIQYNVPQLEQPQYINRKHIKKK